MTKKWKQGGPAMTPERMREILEKVHLSARRVAVAWGEHQTIIQRMLSGAVVIPDEDAEWLEEIVAPWEKQPLPKGRVPRVEYLPPSKAYERPRARVIR